MKVIEICEQDPENIIIDLLSEAKDSIWMSTNLQKEFYDRPTIKKVMADSLFRVKDFKLLLEPNVDWETRKVDLNWLKEIIQTKQFPLRKSEERVLHWIIVDGNNIRLEQPHEDGATLTSNMVIKGADQPYATDLQQRFLAWWNKAVPIPV
jgi:hypothetical protein